MEGSRLAGPRPTSVGAELSACVFRYIRSNLSDAPAKLGKFGIAHSVYVTAPAAQFTKDFSHKSRQSGLLSSSIFGRAATTCSEWLCREAALRHPIWRNRRARQAGSFHAASITTPRIASTALNQ